MKEYVDAKLKRAVFGLRPVAREFSAGIKWPMEEIKIGRTNEKAAANAMSGPNIDDIINEDGNNCWYHERIVAPAAEEIKAKPEPMNIDATKSAWGEEAIILPEEPVAKPEEKAKEATAEVTGGFVTPTQGTELALIKIKGSLISGLHCAVGEYETALRLLQKQIALINPAPLKPAMQHTHMCAKPRFSLLANTLSADMQLVDINGKPVVPIKVGLLSTIHKVLIHLTIALERNELHDRRQLR